MIKMMDFLEDARAALLRQAVSLNHSQEVTPDKRQVNQFAQAVLTLPFILLKTISQFIS